MRGTVQRLTTFDCLPTLNTGIDRCLYPWKQPLKLNRWKNLVTGGKLLQKNGKKK